MTPEQFQAYCLAQSNYWIAYANTPMNKKRKVYHLGYLLTEDELIEDAFNTAKQHLDNYWKSCNGIEV